MGITVTRKVNKRAVVRNKIKRQAREFFRYNRHRLKKSADIVVISLRDASGLASPKVWGELYFLFRKAGLLTDTRRFSNQRTPNGR